MDIFKVHGQSLANIWVQDWRRIRQLGLSRFYKLLLLILVVEAYENLIS
ncbi:hypothetical protein EMIT093MI4_40371 [Pseudomonas sp. IT-93MI4]